jgi:predicted amidohydrolase YtcJ
MHAGGELSVRVHAFISQPFIKRMLASGARSGLGNEWVRLGAMKMVADGSISERDARVSEPYVGRPGDYGILVRTAEQLFEDSRAAHAAGWHIGTHANGDVAIDIILRVYERLQRETPRRDPRFRIEHCTIINDDLVRRIKARGVIPTPFSSYVYYHGEKMEEYGAERLNRMFAPGSFLDADIRATMSSDYPPGPFEPMMFLQSSVHPHRYQGQRVGTAAAHQHRGSFAGGDGTRRLRVVRGENQRLYRSRQAGRSHGAGPGSPAGGSPVAGNGPGGAHNGGRTLGVRGVMKTRRLF